MPDTTRPPRRRLTAQPATAPPDTLAALKADPAFQAADPAVRQHVLALLSGRGEARERTDAPPDRPQCV